MTIQQKLLNHYQKVYDILSTEPFKSGLTLKEMKKFCYDETVHFGVCKCALWVFTTCVYDTDWVKENCNSGGALWGGVPECASDISGLLIALKLRIDILTKIINKG